MDSHDTPVRPDTSASPARRRAAQRRALSMRDVAIPIGLLVVGLAIVVIVWNLAGRTAGSALPAHVELDRPADELSLATLDGTPVRLSDYRGKVVLLNFWYTDCPPCKEETPALQASYQRLADQGLVVLGVNIRTNERDGEVGDADIRAFTQQYGVTYPIIIDTNREAGRAYQVNLLPSTYFIDTEGVLRYARFGPINADEVEQFFTALKAQVPTAQR